MGRRSWIHLMYSKQDYWRFYEGIKDHEFIFEVGAAILDGPLHCAFTDRIFGEEGKKSLVVLTQSDGSLVIDELVETGAITDRSTIFCLDDVDSSLLENKKKGTRIMNAEYFATFEEFEKVLNTFENDDEFNNARFQATLEERGKGLLFMCYFCRIVMGIYGFCQEKGAGKSLDSLFQQAQDIVNDLGWWYHADHFPISSITYNVEDFLINSHKIKIPEFAFLREYIDYIGDDLTQFLSNITQKEKEEPPKPNKNPPEFQFFLWQLGELQARIMDSAQENDKPIPYQPFFALKELFISVGNLIYGTGDESTILMDADRVAEEIVRLESDPFEREFSHVLKTTEDLIAFMTENLL